MVRNHLQGHQWPKKQTINSWIHDVSNRPPLKLLLDVMPTFMKHPQCVKICTGVFYTLFNPHRISTEWLLSPFYRWRNWGSGWQTSEWELGCKSESTWLPKVHFFLKTTTVFLTQQKQTTLLLRKHDLQLLWFSLHPFKVLIHVFLE